MLGYGGIESPFVNVAVAERSSSRKCFFKDKRHPEISDIVSLGQCAELWPHRLSKTHIFKNKQEKKTNVFHLT